MFPKNSHFTPDDRYREAMQNAFTPRTSDVSPGVDHKHVRSWSNEIHDIIFLMGGPRGGTEEYEQGISRLEALENEMERVLRSK